MFNRTLHDISCNREACEVLAEKLELEGDEGLGEFVRVAINETLAEMRARKLEGMAKDARNEANN